MPARRAACRRAVLPQSASLLQGIEQRLTTRENLAAMIDRHGLFADLPGLTLDQKIFALRSAVQFQSVASAAPASFGVPNAVSAPIISTRFPDGDQAARAGKTPARPSGCGAARPPAGRRRHHITAPAIPKPRPQPRPSQSDKACGARISKVATAATPSRPRRIAEGMGPNVRMPTS